MANTSLTLGAHWELFIKQEISNGRYASASEVIRAALRMLEENRANTKLNALRAALIEGESSGDAGELDIQALRDEIKAELGLK
jgi:antitoxin ParD1/3/4